MKEFVVWLHQRKPACSSYPSYTGLGDKERALEWLEKAFEDRSWEMIRLKIDPRLDPLRADPRFQDMLRRMGLGA
ncbi:MAG: TPR end-of-group domain-containing protein [bacterium]